MKTYKIINSDILFKGKLFPENGTINLDDKDAGSLSAYLITLSSVSSRAESRDEGSSASSTEKESKNNKRK